MQDLARRKEFLKGLTPGRDAEPLASGRRRSRISSLGVSGKNTVKSLVWASVGALAVDGSPRPSLAAARKRLHSYFDSPQPAAAPTPTPVLRKPINDWIDSRAGEHGGGRRSTGPAGSTPEWFSFVGDAPEQSQVRE